MFMLFLVLMDSMIPQATQVVTQQGYRETHTPPGSRTLHLSTPQQRSRLPHHLVLSIHDYLMT